MLSGFVHFSKRKCKLILLFNKSNQLLHLRESIKNFSLYAINKIVISSNNIVSSIFTMHLAVNNILVWYKSILIETLSEYYLHILDENLQTLNKFNSSFEDLNQNLTDCYASEEHVKIQKFSVDLKPYLYPATIEFSITCATIFIITWNKIGTKNINNYGLPPTKKVCL